MKNDQEFNIKFVQLIANYPELYDYTMENYSNKYSIEKTWKVIAKLMNERAKDCMEKWRTLRGGFVRYLRNKPPSSGSDAKKEYYLAKYMQFLVPYIKFRPHKGSFDLNFDGDPKDKQIQENSRNKNSCDKEDEADHDEDSVNTNYIEEFDIKVEDDIVMFKEENNYSSNSETIKRKRMFQDQEEPLQGTIFSDYVSCKKARIDEGFHQLIEENADLNFLKSLLPDIAVLSRKKKNIFKIGVLNILNKLIEDVVDSSKISYCSSQSHHQVSPSFVPNSSNPRCVHFNNDSTLLLDPQSTKNAISNEAEDTLSNISTAIN